MVASNQTHAGVALNPMTDRPWLTKYRSTGAAPMFAPAP